MYQVGCDTLCGSVVETNTALLSLYSHLGGKIQEGFAVHSAGSSTGAQLRLQRKICSLDWEGHDIGIPSPP